MHVKNDAESELFNIHAPANSKTVMGLSPESQLSLMMAAQNGVKILSSGLPVDVAAKINEFYQKRYWNTVRADGSTSSGSTPEVLNFVAVVKNQDAYERLKSNALFNAAFDIKNPTGEFAEPQEEAEVIF
jgi:hypothetical protein